MNRIFIPLGLISAVLLLTAFVLGWQIDDPRVLDAGVQRQVQWHFLIALAALCFTTLVHAIVLTYFMGTGRWIEETSSVYQLAPELHQQNQKLKYQIVPAIVAGFLLLLAAGGLGAAADPASPSQFQGWLGISPAIWHRSLALLAVSANLAIHGLESVKLYDNSQIISRVLQEVRRIRLEKGLPV
jgi:hypothetical protein